MSTGPTKDSFTTAEEIVIQYSDNEDIAQDEGENLVQLLDDEEGEE